MALESDLLARIVERLDWQDRLAEKEPDLLWHYTSVNGFQNIVRGKVYLSCLDRMNDSREGKWLSSHLRDMVFPLNTSVVSAMFSPPYGRDPVGTTFAFSLSQESDLLSQWRAYANGGRGLAIGFDGTKLRAASRPITQWESMCYESEDNRTTFCQVEYLETAAMRDIASQIVELVSSAQIEAEEEWNSRHAPNSSYRGLVGRAFSGLGRNIGRIIRHLDPMFKNAAFKEESEWRILLYEGTKQVHEGTNLAHKDLCYTFTEDDITRHHALDISGSIKQIKIGPLCRADETAIDIFLKSVGMRLDPGSITKSSATLQATRR